MTTKKSTAQAQHILVKDEATCVDLINRIKDGEDFAALAGEHSLCPSGKNGGDLGTFSQGMMVPAFDQVIFDTNNMGLYTKPVKTQFGYHVINIKSRSDHDKAKG